MHEQKIRNSRKENIMENINMTVKQFADSFIPCYTKVRVIKSSEIIFFGALEELYYSGITVLGNIVAMVTADGDTVCLCCRR